jgi:Flp pilus assembly protein CpaB
MNDASEPGPAPEGHPTPRESLAPVPGNPWKALAIGLAIVLLLVMLAIGATAVVVYVRMGSGRYSAQPLARPAVQIPKAKAGEILIPISAKSIQAYTKITEANITFAPVAEKAATDSGAIKSVRQVSGRIARVNINANSAFKEEQLLPPKSSPGWQSAVRDDWVAVQLDRSQLEGAMTGLNPGDWVALTDSTGKWVAQKAQVFVPYDQTTTTNGRTTTTVTGRMIMQVPKEASLVLSAVLAQKTDNRIRVWARGPKEPADDDLLAPPVPAPQPDAAPEATPADTPAGE